MPRLGVYPDWDVGAVGDEDGAGWIFRHAPLNVGNVSLLCLCGNLRGLGFGLRHDDDFRLEMRRLERGLSAQDREGEIVLNRRGMAQGQATEVAVSSIEATGDMALGVSGQSRRRQRQGAKWNYDRTESGDVVKHSEEQRIGRQGAKPVLTISWSF